MSSFEMTVIVVQAGSALACAPVVLFKSGMPTKLQRGLNC